MYLDQHRFAMQLAQLSRGWRAELDRRLADLGLSQARWLVLLHLARFDHEPTQRELAQSVAVEGPTLARLLDSLEAQGLVQRKAAPEDRRAKLITLQPSARPMIEKIEAISTQVRQELFNGIPEEDLRKCQQVHARILSNLVKR
ncbi:MULTISPECIES: MarR family transcriptional regulator [Pseudomonadaceae]|jgi:MarR family transcriptional regulator for hemolysin|uniref:MarR family transcriptional regulator n=1 Tax=Pseudomonas saudiphocaensis TaxID=1499686 RepID=A0A078LPS8_9PSED|nr:MULTISPECIES: MarR family transcriptional regulator [Pseudomonadaceae]MBE7928405.1 MarR family transcriptional regulator [Pseudomonas saudiphocaensis]MCF6783307.1 MarR family transcriptional regulator [Stutzerimonas stutzeri]MCF6806255.1 MarR family transcriptional regulator [Stutzerimonas stutzeri]RRV18174.1 MarR family transcriptional regulator [Pseudomonas saudiphocaensis]CDZ93104.1 MarR family transcriptional regulator [Pseudomonas saudiphocaensis]